MEEKGQRGIKERKPARASGLNLMDSVKKLGGPGREQSKYGCHDQVPPIVIGLAKLTLWMGKK